MIYVGLAFLGGLLIGIGVGRWTLAAQIDKQIKEYEV